MTKIRITTSIQRRDLKLKTARDFIEILNIIHADEQLSLDFKNKYNYWSRNFNEEWNSCLELEADALRDLKPSKFLRIASTAIISLCLLEQCKCYFKLSSHLILGLSFYVTYVVMNATFALLICYLSSPSSYLLQVYRYFEYIISLTRIHAHRINLIKKRLNLETEHCRELSFHLCNFNDTNRVNIFFSLLSSDCIFGFSIAGLIFVLCCRFKYDNFAALEIIILYYIVYFSIIKNIELLKLFWNVKIRRNRMAKLTESFMVWFGCKCELKCILKEHEIDSNMLSMFPFKKSEIVLKDRYLNAAIFVTLCEKTRLSDLCESDLEKAVLVLIYGWYSILRRNLSGNEFIEMNADLKNLEKFIPDNNLPAPRHTDACTSYLRRNTLKRFKKAKKIGNKLPTNNVSRNSESKKSGDSTEAKSRASGLISLKTTELNMKSIGESDNIVKNTYPLPLSFQSFLRDRVSPETAVTSVPNPNTVDNIENSTITNNEIGEINETSKPAGEVMVPPSTFPVLNGAKDVISEESSPAKDIINIKAGKLKTVRNSHQTDSVLKKPYDSKTLCVNNQNVSFKHPSVGKRKNIRINDTVFSSKSNTDIYVSLNERKTVIADKSPLINECDNDKLSCETFSSEENPFGEMGKNRGFYHSSEDLKIPDSSFGNLNSADSCSVMNIGFKMYDDVKDSVNPQEQKKKLMKRQLYCESISTEDEEENRNIKIQNHIKMHMVQQKRKKYERFINYRRKACKENKILKKISTSKNERQLSSVVTGESAHFSTAEKINSDKTANSNHSLQEPSIFYKVLSSDNLKIFNCDVVEMGKESVNHENVNNWLSNISKVSIQSESLRPDTGSSEDGNYHFHPSTSPSDSSTSDTEQRFSSSIEEIPKFKSHTRRNQSSYDDSTDGGCVNSISESHDKHKTNSANIFGNKEIQWDSDLFFSKSKDKHKEQGTVVGENGASKSSKSVEKIVDSRNPLKYHLKYENLDLSVLDTYHQVTIRFVSEEEGDSPIIPKYANKLIETASIFNSTDEILVAVEKPSQCSGHFIPNHSSDTPKLKNMGNNLHMSVERLNFSDTLKSTNPDAPNRHKTVFTNNHQQFSSAADESSRLNPETINGTDEVTLNFPPVAERNEGSTHSITKHRNEVVETSSSINEVVTLPIEKTTEIDRHFILQPAYDNLLSNIENKQCTSSEKLNFHAKLKSADVVVPKRNKNLSEVYNTNCSYDTNKGLELNPKVLHDPDGETLNFHSAETNPSKLSLSSQKDADKFDAKEIETNFNESSNIPSDFASKKFVHQECNENRQQSESCKNFEFECENMNINYRPDSESDSITFSYRKMNGVTKVTFKSNLKKLYVKMSKNSLE